MSSWSRARLPETVAAKARKTKAQTFMMLCNIGKLL